MKRFVIRNYGPSIQLQFKDKQIVLSNDQSIEIDNEEMAHAFNEEQQIHVTDRGVELAPHPGSQVEESLEKERPVTANDSEAMYRENHPDNDQKEPVEEEDSERSVELEQEVDEEVSYDDLTVAELKALAKDRQTSVTGLNKGGIVEALQAYDAADAPEE